MQDLIRRLEDVGAAKLLLHDILHDDEFSVFDDLSKHNTYWHHVEDATADKLDEIRRKLRCLEDKLLRVEEYLDKDYSD